MLFIHTIRTAYLLSFFLMTVPFVGLAGDYVKSVNSTTNHYSPYSSESDQNNTYLNIYNKNDCADPDFYIKNIALNMLLFNNREKTDEDTCHTSSSSNRQQGQLQYVLPGQLAD